MAVNVIMPELKIHCNPLEEIAIDPYCIKCSFSPMMENAKPETLCSTCLMKVSRNWMKLMNESKLKHIGKISIALKAPHFRKRNACGVLS